MLSIKRNTGYNMAGKEEYEWKTINTRTIKKAIGEMHRLGNIRKALKCIFR